MKISQEHVILITNLYLSKQYDAQRLLSKLVGNLLKRIRKSVRCVAIHQDLVLSQEDKPKGTDQLVRVKLPFYVQVCTG